MMRMRVLVEAVIQVMLKRMDSRRIRMKKLRVEEAQPVKGKKMQVWI